MIGMRWWNRILSLFFIIHFSLLTAVAKTKIMVISDPHVMGPGLLISEGEAWYNAVKFDRKLNEYSRMIFDEVIATAMREKPDLFLISGDLTKDGELLSHQYVVKKLTELKDAGIKALVIPGNHDMGTLNHSIMMIQRFTTQRLSLPVSLQNYTRTSAMVMMYSGRAQR